MMLSPSALLKPRPRPRLSAYADAHLVLPSGGNARPGPFTSGYMPGMAGILDALADPLIEHVTIVKPVQCGVTTALLALALFHLAEDPAPILLVEPDLGLAASTMQRVRAILQASPLLRPLVKISGRRDSENTKLRLVATTGATLTAVGSNSPSGVASLPIRILLLDDLDRFSAVAGQEGDVVVLATGRTLTFQGYRKIVAASSPTLEGSSRIEALYEVSDGREFLVSLACCGVPQALAWDQIVFGDGTAPELACVHCGAVHTEAAVKAAGAGGAWQPTRAVTGHAGFRIPALVSPWVHWAELVATFQQAKGDPASLQAWTNTRLGRCWREGSRVEVTGLASRRAALETVPAWVRAVTAGADCQLDRLEVAVWGWGAAERSMLLCHHVVLGGPEDPAAWGELDQLLRGELPVEGGGTLRIGRLAIDAGYARDAVLRFVKARARVAMAVRGSTNPAAPILSRPSRNNELNVPIVFVGHHLIKDILYSRLKIESPEEGRPYIGFCSEEDGCTAEWLQQLTAETKVSRWREGRWRSRYELPKQSIENHALDASVYAFAALRATPYLLAQLATGSPTDPAHVQLAAKMLAAGKARAAVHAGARSGESWATSW